MVDTSGQIGSRPGRLKDGRQVVRQTDSFRDYKNLFSMYFHIGATFRNESNSLRNVFFQ
jgi:hypothetical protein